MAKTPTQTPTNDRTKLKSKNEVSKMSSSKEIQVKMKRPIRNFKPDIKVAKAIVGAIAFLQKSGLQANSRNIKNYITQRQGKNFQRNLYDVPKYLNRGLELGILKKCHGGYKIGELRLRNRKPRSRKLKIDRKNMEDTKEVDTESKSAGQSRKSSVVAF